MTFRRRMFSWALRAWLATLGTLVFAQILPGQWVGELYMVRLGSSDDQLSWAFIDEHDRAQRVIPSVRDSADSLGICQSCVGSSPSYWHGDALHTLAGGGEVMEDGKTFRLNAFVKWQDGEWGILGTFKTHQLELLNVLPCDNGRFLAISCFADIVDNKRSDRTPFCRLSLREGKDELRIDTSIDHGQDDLRKFMGEEPRMDPSMDYAQELLRILLKPNCFKLAGESSVVLTDGRATLVNRETGLYWVFSTETARLVKAGNIFKSVTPEMVARGGFHRAVLCVQPEKSGTVLLSAQDESLFTVEKEDAHKEAAALYEKHENQDEMSLGFYAVDWIEEQRSRRLKEIKSRSPLTVWYRIHPENGRVERLAAPPEGGASFRADREYWRPMPDGSVKMGWTYLNVKMPVDDANGSAAAKSAAKEAGGTGPDPAEDGVLPEGHKMDEVLPL